MFPKNSSHAHCVSERAQSCSGMAADTSTAVVIVGSDSEDESTARKRRRLKASSRSEIVDLTLATTTEGRRRSSDIGNASSSSGSAVVEIQADKEGTQKEVVFVLSDESDPDLGQTASTTTIDSAATTVDTDSDAQVALELQLQEWAPSKKAVKKAAKHFNKKKPKGGNPSPVSSSYIANNYSPSSQDVAFLSQSGPSVAWTGTPFTPSNTPSFPPPLPSQPPPFQPPPFQPPSSFQLPQLSYLSSSSSNYLPPASSIPPTPSYYSAASSNLSTTVDNYSTPQLSTACLPSHWAPFSDCQQQSLPYQLIELPMDTAETQQIISDFIKSKFRTIRVSRIQSPCLWRRYETERNNIIAERGKDYNLNERLLYHTSNAPVATICTEGLDMRLSRAGHFGKGIYFR